MSDRPIRVVQWTTGNVARQAIAAIVERPDLELVGVYAHSKQKAGRDVGELAGLGRTLGILATDDIEASSRSRPTASSTCRCIRTWST
jgi:2,4-diaminopentanoate dehydrogenase